MKTENYQFYNGFESLAKEHNNVSIGLDLEQLPAWLKGNLLKVGPACFQIGKQPVKHWFDGLAMLYKFEFTATKISFSNAFVKSAQYKAHLQNQMLYNEFATNAKIGTIRKIVNLFATMRGKNILSPSCNVNIARINNNFLAMTEANNHIAFYPDSLNTKGLIIYKDELQGHISTAHPHFDHYRNELINVLIQINATGVDYQIYTVASSQDTARNLFVKFSKSYLFYMHSFFVTPNYIILYDGPLQTTPSKLLINTFNDALTYNQEHQCELIFINRNNHEITHVPVEPFLFLHSINSFETDNEQIILDLIAYPQKNNPYNMFYLSKLATNHIDITTELRRYTIELKNKQISYKKISNETIEFPYINSKYHGKQYNYVFATYMDKSRPNDFLNGIIKINVNGSNDILKWHKPNLYPSEPIFVKNPIGKDEDDGVLITNVYNSTRHISQILILDAKTFFELAFLDLPCHIPFTLHGKFYET